MTRLYASRHYLTTALLLTSLALAGCQHPGQSGSVQVQSPSDQTPPSHRRPPAGTTGPQTTRAPVPPSRPSPQISPNAAVITSAPPAPQPQLPTGSQPVPSPDLPSLTHLLQRAPQASGEVAATRPIVPPPATSDTVRVGLLLPLSGRNATIGKAMLNAAQLAVFDFADRRLELLPIDTQGSALGAQTAVATAIGDGAQIILGPLLADSVRAVAPAARAAGVPVIAFSSDRRISGGGIYTMGFLPEDQVRRVVSYAAAKGITRFGALAPDNAYGATVFETLRAIVTDHGGEITAAQFYDPSAGDFTDVVRTLADYDERRKALLKQREELEKNDDEVSKLALKRLENLQTIGDLPFDALLIADGGKRLQSVAALLPFYDIDPSKVRMLGTGQWDVPGLGAEPALLGGWYAAPDPGARTAFDAQYQEAYGGAPVRLATLAYDATALAAVLARVEGGPDFSAATLMSPSGFDGRDGIFRFLSSGVAERGLAVMQVRQRDARVIQKAPATFQALVN